MNYRERYPVSAHLEGYIAIRQCFDDPTDYFSLVEADESRDLGPEFELAISSGDLAKRAAVLAIPLGRAVHNGAQVLRSSGTWGPELSPIFWNRLRVLLHSEYEIAADAVRPDNDNIPAFPFDTNGLLQGLVDGPDSKRAIPRVLQLLQAE